MVITITIKSGTTYWARVTFPVTLPDMRLVKPRLYLPCFKARHQTARSGFHTLDQDIDMPNKTLTISGTNITLNLNQHTLNIGIAFGVGVRSVTIRNGTLGSTFPSRRATSRLTLENVVLKNAAHIENATFLKLKDIKASGLTASGVISIKNSDGVQLDNVTSLTL